jgi:hypothetical protein
MDSYLRFVFIFFLKCYFLFNTCFDIMSLPSIMFLNLKSSCLNLFCIALITMYNFAYYYKSIT